MSKPGHNSKVQAGPISADRLKSFIERVEKLEEERKAIGGDIKDVYSEAKGVGYDVKTMRKVVSLRAMDAADRAEQETLLDVYWHALTQIDRVEARVAGGESIRAGGEGGRDAEVYGHPASDPKSRERRKWVRRRSRDGERHRSSDGQSRRPLP